MNFFGLTSLGPRSTLGHAATNAKHQRLQEVTDEQVLKVFDAFDEKKDGTVARKQLRALLDALYNHPPPENEVALFTKYFDTHQSGNPQNKNLKFFAAKNFSNRRLTKAEFQAALTYVRQELNNEQTLSGEYNKAYLPPPVATNPNAPAVVLTSLPTSSAAPYAYVPEAFAVAQPTQRYAAPVTAASLTKNLFNTEPVRGGKLAAAGAAVVAGGKGAAPAAAAGGAAADSTVSARALAAAVAAPGHASGAAQTAGIGVPRIAVHASAPFATTTAAPAAAAAAANAPAKEQPLTESARYAASHGAPAPPKAAEFKSGAHYREKMRKHTRLQHDPKDKFRLPVTTSHEYGWFEAIDAERVPVCPKNSCPETMFASEMVKSGIYF